MGYLPSSKAEVTLTSDAAGSWGCGAFWSSRWFQFQWSVDLRPQSTAEMELIPILFGLAIWGPQWHAHHVTCLCDNQAVVAVINKGSTKDPGLAHLLRCISFYAAHYQFSLSANHVPGDHNVAVDVLSRDNVSRFLSILPQALPTPDPILQELIQMAAIINSDWTCPVWRARFMATLSKA